MAEPTSLMQAVDRLPTSVAWTCSGVFVLAIVGFYTGVPGFALMSHELVGALSVAAALAALLPAAKLIMARSNVPRVNRSFSKLSSEQQEFLKQIRRTGKSWFKAHAAGLKWFDELQAYGYVDVAHPMLLIPGEAITYEITPQGHRALSKVVV